MHLEGHELPSGHFVTYSLKEHPLSVPTTYKVKKKILQRSWWVLLFIAVCFGIYSHAIHKKRETIASLKSYLQSLKEEKEALIQDQEELLLNINSQSDPAWIEMTLMKGLGLVPEGKTKVYFEKEE